ncbi:hypothetical protein GSI_06943 [Ganoderma sinense ZZ0214-1]|uniref:Ribosomal protein/NADH dehydrogenase domain-containing protein n=1 Tax=Ganoderma sinense ZZ0214-1 TaxID=1077348 RepID=A0A2G8SAJ5_9APHY|nr:hypothetical protein GSI_06943 [Ganoderma sinense ZZ0214-1]
MPRKPKTIPGPSRLSRVLAHLTQEPRPFLPNLKSLKLTYAYRNDHFGARHFVKEDLPRIQYANPAVNIQVNKLDRTKIDSWKPEMIVETKNGVTHKVNMEGKWSTAIYNELMELTAGSWWQKWKQQESSAGHLATRIPPPPKKTGASAVLP